MDRRFNGDISLRSPRVAEHEGRKRHHPDGFPVTSSSPADWAKAYAPGRRGVDREPAPWSPTPRASPSSQLAAPRAHLRALLNLRAHFRRYRRRLQSAGVTRSAEYVCEKHGADRISQVVTHGVKAKAVLEAPSRVMGWPLQAGVPVYQSHASLHQGADIFTGGQLKRQHVSVFIARKVSQS